ncbi:MAG: D-alanyl-D-alanine carboxypeptidase [Oscillospiraceae bacterium]|nr:D-alanyl-D-alanine carboxypeptidase [Oscillospiraceae bacterium]
MHAARKLLSFVLCAVLLLSLSAAAFADSSPSPFELTVRIDGAGDAAVRAYADCYAGNLYLSLTDLSLALRGTDKQFRMELSYNPDDGEFFVVRTGQSAAADGRTRLITAPEPGVTPLGLTRNRLYLDESERKYYTYRSTDRDLYMHLTDVQLMLDLTAQLQSDGSVRLDPGKPFAPDLNALIADGYFDAFNGIVLADADTGKALYTSSPNRVAPIASLSKLMSYLLLAEAMDDGRLHESDIVPISKDASQLSLTIDGIIHLAEGARVPVSELMDAMLLASSNECALALAEYTAGSESAFVEQMREKAAALGLGTAEFYTPHGLPVYAGGVVSAKLQNRMSALDLFRLIRTVLAEHPEITAITAKKYQRMPSLDYATANSNPLLFNLEGVNGLKTGSTNKAGYCLAATLPVTAGGETHTVVLVLLGAETADVRGQAAEILLRYARSYYETNGF